MAQSKQRIVILGGGVSSLATAWELTNRPDWQQQYDISVYQLGWRLGGKCASGRGPYGRIEEHGIHVLMGFYDNVFDILQSCYAAINRPPQAPLATWQQAVAPQNNVVLMENVRGRWIPWQFKFKYNSKVPGQSKTRREPHAVLYALLRQMLAIHRKSPLCRSPHANAHKCATETCGHQQALRDAIEKLNPGNANDQFGEAEKQELLTRLTEFLTHLLDLPLVQHAIAVASPTAPTPTPPSQTPPSSTPPSSTPQGTESRFHEWMEKAWDEAKTLVKDAENDIENDVLDPMLRDIRRAIIQIKLGYAIVRGVLCDGVLTLHGWNFAAINNLDLRQWIAQNLANLPGDSEETLNSAPVRGIYDLVFAYTDGRPGEYALEAGTALDFMLRIVFEYKGAIYWKMQAGMGDVVLAPLYLTLKERGVNFHFFHSVRQINLDATGKSIGSVELAEQVTVKSQTGEYNPLFDVKELPCFPAEPLYDQLDITPEEEAQLRLLQAEFNGLESPWTTWTDRGSVTLEAGRDFDTVVLGISIAALPKLCPGFGKANPNWQQMIDSVKTTATQSAQIWLEPTLPECGWHHGVCVLDAYEEMLNTWTDMSDLIVREDWPVNNTPGSIAYFTGPLPDQSTPRPDDDHRYPGFQYAEAHQNTMDWLDNNTKVLFPRAVVPQTQGLDYNLLIDTQNREGKERFNAQYWRANVNPSDHYVLSVPGSSQYRLAAGDSGFANLILAGDWTLNGMNAGSVEAAATSGILAAHALLDTQSAPSKQ